MPAPADDWTAQLRLAEFDRLTADVRRWVETAPVWPPYDRARALWGRISSRLDELRVHLDRVLVVGVVGGTGTGKSTLLNALVGERICPAGDVVRPTTRQPVVLAHPNADSSLLNLADCQFEVQRLAAPILEQMILIDCPDPDTQDRGDGQPAANAENRNLEVLRRVLPHCDVLLCTGTAQKYKTQAVTEELLHHAPGRQVVFVQTHAALDADITADWQRHLESQGFRVPQMFRLDGEDALERTQQQRPAPPEFSRLVDFLNAELSGRARRRILRANALDLLDWFLGEIERDIAAALPNMTQLEDAIAAQRERLFANVQTTLGEQLRGHQGVWRARLLNEVTLRWGGGPFAAFLRLLGSARSWLHFIPALRARSLGPMLVTGGIGIGKAVADRVRQSWAETNWLNAAELGIAPGDVAQANSVLAGFAHQAGVEVLHPAVDRLGDESLATAARRLYQQVESDVAALIERRAAGRGGAVFHGLLEILFLALPAMLLWRLAKDFFYEHLWLESNAPLLGFDFLIQSALWVLVWGLLLRGLLAWRLQRGLKRDIAGIIDRLTPDAALGPMFHEFAALAAAIRQHAERLPLLRADVNRLRRELESVGPWQLGRLSP